MNKIRRTRIDRKNLLKEWSNEVKKRDNNTCQVCGIKNKELKKNGKPAILNSHHLLHKEGKYKYLQYQIMNGICLCQNCHKFSTIISAHKQELVFFVWFSKNKKEQFEWLVSRISMST